MSFALNYTASPTCREFIKSRAPRKILAGPVGGGKTSCNIIHLLLNGMQQAPDNDGIRRTRHLIVRNTVPMLKTTTIKSFLDWIPDGTLGRWHSTDKTYHARFEDVEAEFLFMALEDANDVRKLLSLETTTVFFNEFKEIDQDVVEALIGTKRVGRYPSMKDGPGATFPCMLADTNMPAFDTWHQKVMDGEIPGWTTFKQPSGRSAQAENLQYLPPDYYNTEGLSDEYVRTMIDVQYGTSREGLPVFRHTFQSSFHVATEPLEPLQSANHPLIIGLDAGLTPAALIAQQTPRGAVNALAECYVTPDESMGMDRFLTTKLIPLLRTPRFSGLPVQVIIDPAGMQRSQPTEETVMQIVQKHRLKVLPAPTNKIDLRISSMETLLARQVGGKAGFLICPTLTFLIQAFQHGYKYAAKKDGELQEKPAKNKWSHLMDGTTYMSSYVCGEERYINNSLRREIKPAKVKIV